MENLKKRESLKREIFKSGFSTLWAVQPQKVHSSSLCDTRQGIAPKICDCVVVELVPLRGEKKFTPRPQTRTMIPLYYS